MAHSLTTGKFVLFGGFSNVGFNFSDTWEWDGSAWTQQSPPGSPPARALSALTYDPVSGNLLLFGGHGNAGFFSDTWTYQLGPETPVSPVGIAAEQIPVGFTMNTAGTLPALTNLNVLTMGVTGADQVLTFCWVGVNLPHGRPARA